MNNRVKVVHALAHPECYETWQLDYLRSEANWYQLHDAERELRALVAWREERDRRRRELVRAVAIRNQITKGKVRL